MGPLALVALAGSLAATLAYGLVWNARPEGLARTAVKTAAVGCLALCALMAGGPVWLVAGLALGAAGDAALAGSGQRRFLAGLVAFALGHLAYVPMLAGLMEAGSVGDPVRWGLWAGLAGAAMVLVMMLWRSLGPMRAAVCLYALIILLMGRLALALPLEPWALVVTAGALAFIVSDAILAVELFRLAQDAPARRWTRHGVWWLYAGGQSAITLGVLGMSGLLAGGVGAG